MLRLAACVAMLAIAATAIAANPADVYPARPVRILIPQPAGGTMDTTARALSQQVAQSWGQNVVIDNRSGANGIIAGEVAARAQADGYTLLYTSASLANNQLAHRKLAFDMLSDFAPVTQTTSLPGYLVVVNTQLPVRNVKELVELSKTSQSTVHFGSAGHGNSQHLLGELINSRAGAKLVHVPYKGFAAIVTAVMANEVQVAFGPPVTLIPHLKAGRLRAIAYTGAARWPGMPELPTVAESGIPGLVYAASWQGMFAPAGTPPAIVARIYSEYAKAVHAPKTREMLEAGGLAPVGSTPQEFRQFLQTYFTETAEQMRIAKVTPK